MIAGGANYLNGSFYAVGSNGVTVRGQAFATAAGAVEKVNFILDSCMLDVRALSKSCV